MLTVVIRRRARPGRHQAVLRAIRRAEASLLAAATGRLGAAIFQQLDDPHCFLYLGEWTSQAAFEAATASVRASELERLFAHEPEIYYCRPIKSASQLMRQAAAVACTLVEGPDAVADELLDVLVGSRAVLDRAPAGLVEHAIYQDQAAPGRILLIHGWLAAADLERVKRIAEAPVSAQLQALGATISQFAARSQVILGGVPGPG